MKVERTLLTYAFVKSYYDFFGDYLDTFVPFVISTAEKLDINKKGVSISELKDYLKEQFQLDIPGYSLQSIITRAKRKDFLVQREKKVYKGKNFEEILTRLIDTKEVERKINEFIEAAKSFIEKNFKVKVEVEKIRKVIDNFARDYTQSMLIFLTGRNIEKSTLAIIDTKEDIIKYIVEFLIYIEKEQNIYFGTFRELIYGAIICSTLSAREPSEINRKFGSLKIFLDTNFIFSVLGMHGKEDNDFAQELFDLLDRERFQICVFSSTVDELTGVLNAYYRSSSIKQRYGHPKPLLGLSNYTKTDLQELILNIDKKLLSKGIKKVKARIYNSQPIAKSKEYVDLLKIKLAFSVEETALYNIEKALMHDLSTINEIKDIRGSEQRRLEEAKAIFLSSDLKLADYNYQEMGHMNKATIPEVISDKLFTNILWLKNPKNVGEVPVKYIIAAHAKSLLVNRKIWIRFLEILDEMKSKEEIGEEDISLLFYKNQIESELRNKQEQELTFIDSDFIRECVKKFKRQQEQEKEKIISIKEQQIEEIKRKMFTYQRTLEKITEFIKESYRKKAKYISWGTIISGGVILFLPALLIFLLMENITKLSIGIFFILAILDFLGIKLCIGKLSRRLEASIYKWLLKYRMKLE